MDGATQSWLVGELLAITDPELRNAMDDALRRAGEALVLIRYTMAGGLRDWFLVRTPVELDEALAKVSGSYGRSDAVEVYATGELPHRGDDREQLRSAALAILQGTDVLVATDVVMACRQDGNAELQDVSETDDPEYVDEWFEAVHEGELLVGSHPLLTHDHFYPDRNDAFLAYGVTDDGTVVPGAY
jgi:hypothetical protein